jgi:hypothetical protein
MKQIYAILIVTVPTVIGLCIWIGMYISMCRDRIKNGDPYWDAKEGIHKGLLK